MHKELSYTFTALLMASTAVTAPAYAQTAPPTEQSDESSADNGEILVTARRITERLQDVPISITTFSGNELRQQSAQSLPDLVRLSPNTTVQERGGNGASALFQIRGQIGTDIIGTVDPAVGIYVDEVYWARSIGANADLVDVERVEILKGPQGTLFGRNTTGGAVLLRTADPELDEISGRMSATYGNYDQRLLSGTINIPIASDVLALRVAGQINQRDGFARDVLTNEQYDTRDRGTLRAKLLFKPIASLRLLFGVELFDMDEAQIPFNIVSVEPDSLAANPLGQANTIAALGIGFVGTGPSGTATAAEINAARANPRGRIGDYFGLGRGDAALDQDQFSIARAETYSARAIYDTGWGEIKGILAYRTIRNSNGFDLDGSPFNILSTTTQQEFTQWSGELQISGTAFDNRLSVTTGVFAFSEDGFDKSLTATFQPISVNTPGITEGLITNESLGIYAQGSFNITDALTLTAGVRYSVDDKRLISRNRGTSPSAPGGFTCNVPVTVRQDPAVCEGLFQEDFSSIPYTLGLDYRVNPQILIYAKTSRGFRSGGLNLRGGLIGPQSFAPFGPETVTDYEVGLKSDFFSNRIRFNLATFYSDYNDIQRNVVVVSPTGAIGSSVQNAASGRIFGAEAEFLAVVTDDFRIGATVGLLDTGYSDFFDVLANTDRSNEEFDFAPAFTGSLTTAYTREFDFGKFSLRADYSYTSSFATQQGRIPEFTNDNGFGILNARTAIALMDDRLEIAVFGRNLTNARYLVSGLVFNPPVGVIAVNYGAPRTYGLSLSYAFGAW